MGKKKCFCYENRNKQMELMIYGFGFIANIDI